MTFAKILEQDEKWGIVFENFTGMGIMGRVVEDEADIAFSTCKLMLNSTYMLSTFFTNELIFKVLQRFRLIFVHPFS